MESHLHPSVPVWNPQFQSSLCRKKPVENPFHPAKLHGKRPFWPFFGLRFGHSFGGSLSFFGCPQELEGLAPTMSVEEYVAEQVKASSSSTDAPAVSWTHRCVGEACVSV